MKRGFTLVEMLVAIGLVAMLSGVGFASTLRSNEQKKVTESAETLRQYFMQAKTLAQAGRKDCLACGATGGVCGNGDAPLTGWRTTITATTPVTLEMHGECGATPFFSSGIKNMPSRVTLTLSGGAGSVIFYPLNKGTNLANDVTVSIGSTMTGLTGKSFIVKANGEITAIQ